jgi:hypothetical protein
MLIKNLIENLEKLDPNLRVMVETPEGLFDDVVFDARVYDLVYDHHNPRNSPQGSSVPLNPEAVKAIILKNKT